MKALLQRYWLNITGKKYCPNIGVTAFSEEDVNRILKAKIGDTIRIESMKIINSIDDLDQNHVAPNMEEFISRGIWYPKGFKSAK